MYSVTSFGWFVFFLVSESFDSASDVLYILRLHYKLLILKDYFQYSVFNVQCWASAHGLKWTLPLERDTIYLVGLSGLEPPTSRLSGVRSNRLSYKPGCFCFVF